jgi:starch phosphorylase
VTVELYHGSISSLEQFIAPERSEMKAKDGTSGSYEYSVEVVCRQTGRQGYTVRILPAHEGLAHPFIPGLIKWA